ncbi:MAG: hypothetical protein LAO56_08920 [Acidobacteriia bacterium]|nr:hypothetical protein [Terriglobia bacterium]
MRWSLLVLLLLAATFAVGQESGPPVSQEGDLRADFRREGERIRDACKTFNFSSGMECAILFFTDHPLHIAVGSIAPQNGFGVGGAFVTEKNTTNWRLSWDVDAVVSNNVSWRAGGYMKMIHTPKENIRVIRPVVSKPGETPGTAPAKKPRINLVHPYSVFNLYAQSTSLNRLNFFGPDNDSTVSGKSVFGMTETIVGANVIKPVFEWSAISKLNLALLGEANGRFVNIRGNHGESAPSIETVYTDAQAPGLSSQPGFVQLGEGVRIKPVLGDYLQLNYLVKFQQFFAPSSSQNSFLRWTVDLNHTFFLYGYTQSAPKSTDGNGPDECGPLTEKCPPVSHSRNLNGSIGARLLLSESMTSGTSAVPFYFQPTLGGGDLNGAPSLSSYQDYRFRAPNILLLQEKFEHSIWGPLGFTFMADQGRVAVTRGDIGFSHLKHSFGTGLTLRAGGFPMVFLIFAWGGNEGNHTIFNMNTSLLGGSSRPTLF